MNFSLKNWYLKRVQKLNSFNIDNINNSELKESIDNLFIDADERKVEYLLGVYSKSGIDYILNKFGIYKFLKRNGFTNLKLTTSFNNPFKQRIAIYNYEQENSKKLLAEIVIKKNNLNLNKHVKMNGFNSFYNYISIEWICLQNPNFTTSANRSLLPGQNYLGLGIGKKILRILFLLAANLKYAGILNSPQYYHNAYILAKKFYFLDPQKEGLLKLIKQKLQKKWGLSLISWGIERECVFLNNKPLKWDSSIQVFPINKELIKYFNSKHYKNLKQKYYMNNSIYFDFEAFKNSLKDNPIYGLKSKYIKLQ